MTALATVRAAPGLDAYLELLEARLERSVGSHPGLVGEIGTDTLAAGGKRLRPVLVFLCTPQEERASERAVAGGVSAFTRQSGARCQSARSMTGASRRRVSVRSTW